MDPTFNVSQDTVLWDLVVPQRTLHITMHVLPMAAMKRTLLRRQLVLQRGHGNNNETVSALRNIVIGIAIGIFFLQGLG